MNSAICRSWECLWSTAGQLCLNSQQLLKLRGKQNKSRFKKSKQINLKIKNDCESKRIRVLERKSIFKIILWKQRHCERHLKSNKLNLLNRYPRICFQLFFQGMYVSFVSVIFINCWWKSVWLVLSYVRLLKVKKLRRL